MPLFNRHGYLPSYPGNSRFLSTLHSCVSFRSQFWRSVLNSFNSLVEEKCGSYMRVPLIGKNKYHSS